MSICVFIKKPKAERRLPHHILIHDNDFMENIAKSQTYKILHYERKLRKKGKLKFQYEVEDFWRLARDEPDEFYKYLSMHHIRE